MVRLWFSYFQSQEKSSLVVESKGEILSTPLVYSIESKINAATLSQAFT